MNTILGGGIFNARLMQNLREKNGYTYGCYSSLDVDRFNSTLVITTSVRTEVTKGAVAEILLEMERMRNEPVTKEELILAKRSMMGAFGRSLEDPRTVARFAFVVVRRSAQLSTAQLRSMAIRSVTPGSRPACMRSVVT